mgnify:CR=1 FL=1
MSQLNRGDILKTAVLTLSVLNLLCVVALVWPHFGGRQVEDSKILRPSEVEKGDRYFYGAEVLRVIDGDTIEARIDLGFDTSRTEILRLYGIDAPEMKLKERKKGEQATKWLTERLANSEEIHIRTIKDETGSFGRYLAVLFADGENLNQEMLNLGLAAPYEK